MTITKYEAAWEDITSTEAETGNGSTAELKVYVYSDDPDNDTEADVRSYLKANLGTTYFGLARSRIRVGTQKARDNGIGIWEVMVTYNDPQITTVKALTINDPMRISIRSAGNQTISLKFSLGLVEESAVDGGGWELEGTPVQNAMGLVFNEENEVPLDSEGVEVPYGTTEIVVEQAIAQTVIDAGYLITLAEAANQNAVNTDLFLGFAPGTLRYFGFDSQENPGLDISKKYWTLTHSFYFERNITVAELNAQKDALNDALPDFTVGKFGHWHLEQLQVPETILVESEPEVIEKTVKKVQRIAMHRIYPQVSFNALFTP